VSPLPIISSTNSGAVTMMPIAAQRQRGESSRPVGKYKSASGRKRPIDHGQAASARVTITRWTARGAAGVDQQWGEGPAESRRGVTDAVGDEQPADRVRRPVPGDHQSAQSERQSHQPFVTTNASSRLLPAPADHRGEHQSRDHFGDGEPAQTAREHLPGRRELSRRPAAGRRRDPVRRRLRSYPQCAPGSVPASRESDPARPGNCLNGGEPAPRRRIGVSRDGGAINKPEGVGKDVSDEQGGLVVLGLLSVVDLFGPLMTDGDHPPMAIAVGGSVVGLISLILLAFAWQGKRWALAPLITLRIASALLAVPRSSCRTCRPARWQPRASESRNSIRSRGGAPAVA
jgi:hypothetical protein